MKKPLHAAPARLQRMLLRLQKYDICLQFQPGSLMHVSDALSRLHGQNEDDISKEWDWQIHSVVQNLPISDTRLEQVRQNTLADENMQLLKQTIENGWPSKRSECPNIIADYWNYRDELVAYKGIILKGSRIVIPDKMRGSILALLHVGHFGIEKTRQRARTVVFWPGLGKEIEIMVNSCTDCQTQRDSNQKEPLIPHAAPDGPWQAVGTDIFTLNGKNYVLAVDYYSKFIEYQLLPGMSSASVIAFFKNVFSRWGVPLKLVSDNAMQYGSQEFSDFAKSWGFQHVTSSPYLSRSNGLAEKSVAIMKKILTKAKDVQLALLEYRNTPILGRHTPAQLLMNRNLRFVLPVTDMYLRPKLPKKRRN